MVTRFRARNKSEATIKAAPERAWEVLADPELLVRFTPNLRRIDADGNNWTWHLTRLPVLSSAIEPSFTVLMEFEEPRRIVFHGDESRTHENAGVEGEYHLKPVGGSTHLSVDLSIWVDLPLPGLTRPAVERLMTTVVAAMGMRFGQNMRRYLGE